MEKPSRPAGTWTGQNEDQLYCRMAEVVRGGIGLSSAGGLYPVSLWCRGEEWLVEPYAS